jgi:hypothetical protein
MAGISGLHYPVRYGDPILRWMLPGSWTAERISISVPHLGHVPTSILKMRLSSLGRFAEGCLDRARGRGYLHFCDKEKRCRGLTGELRSSWAELLAVAGRTS